MRYKKSNELFKRANKVIPLASQTFSKSYISYPKNHLWVISYESLKHISTKVVNKNMQNVLP